MELSDWNLLRFGSCFGPPRASTVTAGCDHVTRSIQHVWLMRNTNCSVAESFRSHSIIYKHPALCSTACLSEFKAIFCYKWIRCVGLELVQSGSARIYFALLNHLVIKTLLNHTEIDTNSFRLAIFLELHGDTETSLLRMSCNRIGSIWIEEVVNLRNRSCKRLWTVCRLNAGRMPTLPSLMHLMFRMAATGTAWQWLVVEPNKSSGSLRL